MATPHGIGTRRWEEIAVAFRVGGYVTVYEADAYLRLERGTCKRAALAGQLEYRARPRGKKTRYFVRAGDAERLHGIQPKAAGLARGHA